ncbi:MAG: 6,7-dimethyl-8-ribityllumazine synthase [Thermodesulfobacteriota bacterium]|nr:6,7-dimethyl-8-ribityllumazine synthase [Deltaproteobacteria bacterium TMED58]RZP16357.1 MAG: 6,7-dimethyl-8-ribityllumazine synthase [Candidatus Dadabacteria bacterium]|tara:strand:+ start:47554 stop:48018 length:465 start_codon:yes stop_codon:yes gene_type:complete
MKDEVRIVSEEELHICIVISTFYKNISERQLENASTILIDKLGVKKSQLRVVECLGSLELPYLINSVCKKFKPDGVVALGCIIEGETSHYEVISNAIFDKLIQISINHDTPITSAVLTVKNQSQAEERSNGGVKDRAIEAALSLVNLINLKKEF